MMDTALSLSERVEELEEECRQLKELLVGTDKLWTRLKGCLGLTASESKVVAHLLLRGFATKESIHSALYEITSEEFAQVKIVDVFICKVRRKLRPLGIDVETVWGHGYCITSAAATQIWEQVAHYEIARGFKAIAPESLRHHDRIRHAQRQSPDQGSA